MVVECLTSRKHISETSAKIPWYSDGTFWTLAEEGSTTPAVVRAVSRPIRQRPLSAASPLNA